MFPHGRSLVKKLEGKPFVLLGVNGDGNDPDVKMKNEQQMITWRSFKNERQGKPDITDEWGLQGWPTLILIDHKGVVRQKWVGAPPASVLDQAIEEAVKAAETGA